MIKKFDEFINENIFDGIGKRSKGGVVRKEDGTYVDTILGIKVLLENPNNKHTIEEIINKYSAFTYCISKLSDLGGYYSAEQIKKIKNFEDPYAYLIYDGKYGTSLIIEFATYEEILDSENDDFEVNTSEKDYISLCKCIATAIKEVGNYLSYVPSRNSWGLDKSDDISEYEQEYIFNLIGENSSYNWLIDHEDEADTYLEDFKESITSEFPELNDETFICWSYNDYGCSIGIPLNMNSLLNIKKYVEFTKQWFEL